MSYQSSPASAGLTRALVAATVIALASCDSSVDQLETDRLTLSTPDRIRNAQAINPAAVSALATVNGVEVFLNQAGNGTFSGNVSVPANSVVSMSIQFTEQVSGEALVLATQTQQVRTGSTDDQVTIRRSAYNFDAHDADGDSVSNIIEREENTNPRDENDAPPMVNINVVAAHPEGVGSDSSGKYAVEASIGNSVRLLEQSGNQFRGTFYTVEKSPVMVSAEYIENVTGQKLSVASQSYELSSVFDQQTVTFSQNGYQLSDRDGDSQSDLSELIAGTSIFEAGGNSAPGELSFTTTFAVPSVIQNPGSVYGEFRVDGQTVGLSRNANTYTANSSIAAGTIVVLDVTLKDNFNGTEYIVAQAQKTVPIASPQQVVQFSQSDFNLQIDTDLDNVLNYIEREQASNPLIADSDPNVDPDPDTDPDEPGNGGTTVSCTVSDVPAQVIAAGTQATQSIAGFVDCAGGSYELFSGEYQFNWNSSDNTIQWVPPASATPGSQLSFTVDVRNPANSLELYASFQVNTTIASPDSGCTATTSISDFAAIRDLHVQDDEVFNDLQLRVDSDDRRSLLAFSVPSGLALTGNATLTITVGNDEGDGTINVSQPDAFLWSETDSELEVPQTGSITGSITGSWLSGQQYQFSLSGLKQENTGELALMLSQASGNDVAFLARESGTPAVLSVEVTNDCSS